MRFCQPEIKDLDLSVVCDHDVSGLDVPMDNPFCVGGIESACDLASNVDRFGERKGARCDPFVERLPFVCSHGNERPAVGRLVNFIYRTDVRMIESGGGFRFVDETCLFRGIG